MEPSRDELIQLAEQAAALRVALERIRNELATATAAEEALGEKLRALGVETEGAPPTAGEAAERDEAKTTVGNPSLPSLPLRRARAAPSSTPPAPSAPTLAPIEEPEAEAPEHTAPMMRAAPPPPESSRRSGRSSKEKNASDDRARASRTQPTPSSQGSFLQAAAAGAGLTIGVAIVVLLIANLTRRAAPVAAPSTSATTSISGAAPSAIAPTAAAIAKESPPVEPPSLASAIVPKMIEPPPSAPTAAAPAAPAAAGSGALTIVCTPKCESITDNNVTLPPGNVFSLPVAAGPHKLVLTSNGVKRTVHTTVVPGQLREVKVPMDGPANYDRGF